MKFSVTGSTAALVFFLLAGTANAAENSLETGEVAPHHVIFVIDFRQALLRLDKDERSLRQFVEQRLGLPQVESVEPLREPVIDR